MGGEEVSLRNLARDFALIHGYYLGLCGNLGHSIGQTPGFIPGAGVYDYDNDLVLKENSSGSEFSFDRWKSAAMESLKTI
jgi:hypothetical protein